MYITERKILETDIEARIDIKLNIVNTVCSILLFKAC